ncbi:cinnamoyl-CoA reductase 1-like [Punica granatum]|uniref:Cinnamoyl-CoA reductase 1-like n=1 Tax=Punica granatum TaxID=22663 RepID=A0A6P8EJ09_PUNGR|nr:cinnamoyl-CoA reductase 1-like [Punica granatum]
MEMEMEEKRVCVTGAGGFLGSWIVKLLLSKGYIVHGTVREPGDKKYAHLNKLERASDNLKLFKADLLDYDSLRSAIAGCPGVIHVACPVPTSPLVNPEVEMLEPAIKGTHNVLRACFEAKVKRVVYISSITAVMLNPKWPKDRVKDETCWSDKEYCRAAGNWYMLAKTEAESLAFEFGKKNGLDIVAVNPGYVFGPVLQPTLNFSSLLLLQFVKGTYITFEQGEGDSVPNKIWNIVDVRDVADAVLLAYEKPEAKGRYICVSDNITTEDLVKKLKSLYPDFSYLHNFVESRHNFLMTSEKLQKLGWTYRPLQEMLVDSIENYREAALLD